MPIDRRTFSRLIALATAGAAVPVQSQRNLNIQIGHTGIATARVARAYLLKQGVAVRS
jgi:hypothetical protein